MNTNLSKLQELKTKEAELIDGLKGDVADALKGVQELYNALPDEIQADVWKKGSAARILAAMGLQAASSKGGSASKTARKRKPMSAEAKAKIAKAQKARWAKQKAGK